MSLKLLCCTQREWKKPLGCNNTCEQLWMWKANGNTLNCYAKLSLSFNSPVALIFTPIANLLLNVWIVSTTGQFNCNIKVNLTPKYFFHSNKSLHLFETHCAFLPLFNPNLDLLQAVKVTKSGHYLLHDRASKGYGAIPVWTSQTDLHACLQRLNNYDAKQSVTSTQE